MTTFIQAICRFPSPGTCVLHTVFYVKNIILCFAALCHPPLFPALQEPEQEAPKAEASAKEPQENEESDLIDAPNVPHMQCRVWIETVLGEKLDEDLPKALKSGAVLCKLINTVNVCSAGTGLGMRGSQCAGLLLCNPRHVHNAPTFCRIPVPQQNALDSEI